MQNQIVNQLDSEILTSGYQGNYINDTLENLDGQVDIMMEEMVDSTADRNGYEGEYIGDVWCLFEFLFEC